MSNNLENDRSTTSKMYPIDLAPQKIAIVKSVSNAEMKMAHLMPGQSKNTSAAQIITHTGPVGMIRSAAQIISPNNASQPQMIVSGPPILQGTQIVSQGSQLIGPGTQIISQSQLIGPNTQIMSPATQIISQGAQLSAQVSNTSSAASTNVQVSVASTLSGTQVINVGGQIVSGTGNLVVNSTVRGIASGLKVMSHHNTTTRPTLISSMNVSNTGSVLVNKSVSHVPRGLAAGASLAIRPGVPTTSSQPLGSQASGAWASTGRGPRSTLVYGPRGPLPRPATPRPALVTGHAQPSATQTTPSTPPAVQPVPVPTQPLHSAIVTLPTTTVLASSGVISSTAVRLPAPRTSTPTPTAVQTAPRPLPLLQRNYQSTKVLGVASVGVRAPVGNSAPAQLYYEVPRATALQTAHATHGAHASHALPTHQHQTIPRPVTPYAHNQQVQPAQVSAVNAVQTHSETRAPSVSLTTTSILPRPSILRKREIDGSPTKAATVGLSSGISVASLVSAASVVSAASTPTVTGTGWEDVPAGGSGAASGGSTTISAASSPPPDDEPDPPRIDDTSPRKKPRKQTLTSEVRQCDFQNEETPPTPPPAPVNPPPKRPLLRSSYVCGWRATALHFARPADVRRREPRARDILAIANQKHVLTSAEGWKVHHLTAQMDDLVSLEADVGDQLSGLLRALENASGRALAALHAHSHQLLELLKGNIQRSKIVCEGIQEARDDILRVFTHRNFVSDILARQADKRCFRKHRSLS